MDPFALNCLFKLSKLERPFNLAPLENWGCDKERFNSLDCVFKMSFDIKCIPLFVIRMFVLLSSESVLFRTSLFSSSKSSRE